MRWYARPEGDTQQRRVAPRLASWNKADDRDQVRLRALLDDAEGLLAASRVDGPWALRLDVGLPTGRNLLDLVKTGAPGVPRTAVVRHRQDHVVTVGEIHERSLAPLATMHRSTST